MSQKNFPRFKKLENISKKTGASIDTIILAGNVGLRKQ